MNKISDENSIQDIVGCIASINIDMTSANPEFDPLKGFQELMARINLKISKTRNQTKINWFTVALEYAEKAKGMFECGNLSESVSCLIKCEESIVDGNKAHNRKTTFSVSKNGNVERGSS